MRAVGGPLGVLANLGIVLLSAAPVYLTAYHLRLDSTGVYLLQQCPWRPALIVVVLIAAVCQRHSPVLFMCFACLPIPFVGLRD